MKFLTSQLTTLLPVRAPRRNVRLLIQFLSVLVGLVITYTYLFHVLMEWEGRSYSWITGLYWTLTVMSTLGFGDITFNSDIGRAFSIVVLLSGIIFLLVLLPFTFIEFFYAPWVKAQSEARAPRRLPDGTKNHVLLTSYDPVSAFLIQRLEQYGYPYAVLVGDLSEALRLYDLGVKVVFSAVDRPQTYRNVHFDQAAMLVATGNDRVNTNIAFTAREVSSRVPIVATADLADSEDILALAGASRVLRLPELMGEANARRVSGVDARAHVIGQFNRLLIAEATATGTPLVGKTLAQSRLRQHAGVSVIGLWKRGHFEPATRDSVIDDSTIMVFAASQEQLEKYNELFCIYHVSGGQVIIVGNGRVGRATARALAARDVDYRVIELNPDRIRDPEKEILGSAADVATLERAGFGDSPAIILTAHDDDTNIYLTLYCRRLRPDIQIISRSTFERNVSTLYRAGADFVLSYASMGAGAILEQLQGEGVLTLAEGLNISEAEIPSTLAGRFLADCDIRRRTGCTIVAFRHNSHVNINPDGMTIIPDGGTMIFVATSEAERRFFTEFGVKVTKRKHVNNRLT